MHSDLWTAYQERGDLAARDLLVNEHLGLVHSISRKLKRSFRCQMELDEMVSAGCLGLLGALRDFQRDRGLAFSTFAAFRIRGAILDEARRDDPLTRPLRTKQRTLAQARHEVEQRCGRRATPQEVADHAGIDLNTYWAWSQRVEEAIPLPLERQRSSDEDGFRIEYAASTEPEVEDRLDRESDFQRLRMLLPMLDEQERVVMTLYYLENLNLRQIGDVLQLTESRISQVRAKAIARLRVMMNSSERMAA